MKCKSKISDGAIFKDQFSNSSLDQSGMNGEGLGVATFFNGAYVNEFHQSGHPFFENAREVKMRSVKYAPCKFCVLHKVQEGNTVAEQVDFNNIQSGTTVIQSLGKLL